MNQKLFNVVMFATGAAIGSLVTWKVLKTKYERMLQEEIDMFKEDYARCMQNSSKHDDFCEDEWNDVETEEDDEDDEFDDYRVFTSLYSTSDDDEDDNGKEGEGDEVPYINGPYVVSPEDFNTGEYNRCPVTYYADGVLADSWDVVLDIDETIGEDSLEHFGDYAEEDVVHVRNERLEIDYEVVRDPRTYTDALAATLPRVGMYEN